MSKAQVLPCFSAAYKCYVRCMFQATENQAVGREKKEFPYLAGSLLSQKYVVWCKAGCIWSDSFCYERETQAIMGK